MSFIHHKGPPAHLESYDEHQQYNSYTHDSNFDEINIHSETEATVLDDLPQIDTESQTTAESTANNGHARQTWGSHLSFILASIGAAIGFGNFFRFPYLCYSNGGGAFLIPYLIALFTMGIPLLLMELSMGQIMRKGPMKALRAINNHAGGVGLAASLFGSFFICAYYTVLLAWVVVYFFYTFRVTLPWADNAEAFFFQTVLKRSDSIYSLQGTTGVSWPVLFALIFVWIIIYFCVWRGVKSTGPVSYFTVPLPFLLLAIILIRSLLLPGAATGIYYYLKPDFSLLLQPKIWLNAAGQIFFTLGIGSGVMTAFGSFNKPEQDMVRDNLIVCISNCSFSFFAGFAVFSILGYMAHAKNTTIDQVTTGGIGLAFIVFPEAVSLMPASHLFAILLFLTMFTLGLDSAFALVESLNSVIHDHFPKIDLAYVSLIVCSMGALLGVPFCLTNGFYLIDAVDHYLSDFCLPMIAVAECLVIGWGCAPTSFTDTVMNQVQQAHQLLHGMSTSYREGSVPLKTRIWIFIKVFMTHSVEHWRSKIKATSRWGMPYPLWSFAIKFTIPIFLSILWLTQFVNEIVSPYSTSPESNRFDFVSLVLAIIIPISCLCLIVGLAIFPGCYCLNRSNRKTDYALPSDLVVGSPIADNLAPSPNTD
jgi:NSS family neurotransmitter:Na+ symporter